MTPCVGSHHAILLYSIYSVDSPPLPTPALHRLSHHQLRFNSLPIPCATITIITYTLVEVITCGNVNTCFLTPDPPPPLWRAYSYITKLFNSADVFVTP